jgi:hypothetical protein
MVRSSARTPGRALATFAIGFLLLDAVLFVYSGFALRRMANIVWGGICLGLVALVLVLWRRYRRAMWELEQDRRDLRAEAESIRDLLHGRHLHN